MVLHILHIFSTMTKVSIQYKAGELGQEYDIMANRGYFNDFSLSCPSVYPYLEVDHSDYIYLNLGWGE